ncbi:hypothetical protein [Candidatus Pyrohabitans sp.]
MRWGGLFALVMFAAILPTVYAENLTEEFAKDYIPVSYATVSGDAYFSYIDADADGGYDAIVVFDSATGKVRIINFGTSEIYKSFEVPISSSFALASMTTPGDTSRIVVGSKYLGVYNNKGELIWENKTLPSSVSSIAIADLNGDGNEDEIVVGLVNKIVTFNKNGAELWEREISGRGDNIVAMDIDQDGVKEGVAVSEGYALSIISSGGNLIKKFGKEYFEYRIMKIEAVDLDSDGYSSEIIAVDFRGNVLSFNRSSKIWESEIDYESGTNLKILQLDVDDGVFVLSSSLYKITSLGEKQFYYIGKFKDAVAIDFNADGRTESFAMGKSSVVYAIRGGKQVGYYLDGNEEISPYNKTGARFLAPFDYDGDGYLDDLIAVNPDNQLIIISHLKSKVSGKIVILANLIDYALASDLFEYLRNAGYEVVHVLPENFASYKSEKNIVILGGHKAPDGVGEVVGSLLGSEQKAMLEKPGATERFTFSDIWAPGQRITVFAGNTREETKLAHRQYRKELL